MLAYMHIIQWLHLKCNTYNISTYINENYNPRKVMPSTTLSSTGVVFPDATTQTTALRKDTANTFTALQTFSSSVSVTGTVGASGDISTSGGAVSDSKGDVRRIVGNWVSNGYNTVLADAGKTVFMNAGAIGIVNGIYTQGDVITIVNYSGSNGLIVLYPTYSFISGSNANRGNSNITIRPCGVVTVLFLNASHCFVSGAVY